ncbi:MAG TPA: ATP-binding protein, partial [Solirubrobacteraceae bacterium]|nr:ATP-binding protein [Solirubrobacteraceae bacterium]
WNDSDGTARAERFDLVFESQRSDIDWERLEQPYDLEPVSTTDELVGRSETLSELQDLALGARVGNAFVTGQKRVGKTSIVLTLQSVLSESNPDLAVVYLEAGAFVAPEGAQTIAQLGRIVCEDLAHGDPRLDGAEIPEFEATLAPLRNFVGQLRRRVPKLRVLVILDEFDELPLELYRRGPVGDALFLSLRTLAGIDHIGFVLVGGEKMEPIVDAQGDSLNKFQNHPVSYFDRERHWDDFCDLVRVPVASWLEITDEAIVRLFELTSGHPYFTKMVCRELFKVMKRQRDAHVTGDEIAIAADTAIEAAGIHNFTHFWEDGIVASGEETEEISIRRRKFLLAYAESIEAGDRKLDSVHERADAYGLDEHAIRDLLREFVRRSVLVYQQDTISAKVGLFDRWLARYGVSAIPTTFTDPDAILHAQQRAREEHVQATEITELVRRWGLYRGDAVTPEHVREWLNQFDSIRAQRLMFRVLEAVRFYDASRIRSKLAEAHGMVRRGMTQRIERGKLKRDDIVISYLGEVGKSGVRYARLYADENGIYTDQVVEHGKLPERLVHDQVRALVLIDDLIGSGEQASEFLRELDNKVGGMLEKRGVKCVFVALCGFADAERRVADVIAELRMPVELHICDVLGEEDRCFSECSAAFEDPAERAEARGIAESEGKRLQRRQPLGYRNVQATVVFEDSCPNSTLPILWESRGKWRALFPRHHKPS